MPKNPQRKIKSRWRGVRGTNQRIIESASLEKQVENLERQVELLSMELETKKASMDDLVKENHRIRDSGSFEQDQTKVAYYKDELKMANEAGEAKDQRICALAEEVARCQRLIEIVRLIMEGK